MSALHCCPFLKSLKIGNDRQIVLENIKSVKKYMHKLKGNHNNVGEFVGLFLESHKLFPPQNQIVNPLNHKKVHHFQIQDDFFHAL